MSTEPKTLFEKVWNQHVVVEPKGEPTLLYIDLQLVHEVTSPQAFEGLRLAGRKVRRPDRTIATVDHNMPTTIEGRLNIVDQIAATQIATLRKNCADFGVELYDVNSRDQGIVHVIGPELGITKPGMTIVCGDSHTSTHGAFGALAFGIGTSEVEHVLATQTLPQSKPKTFRISVEGKLPHGVTAKDIILAIIGKIGTDGATGCVIEYAGSAIRALSMEGRMTICNMSIEAGARAGMIAPDETTFAYLKGRRFRPKGEAWEQRSRRVVQAAHRSRRKVRSRTRHRRRHARSLRQLGHQPRHGRARHLLRPRPRRRCQRTRPQEPSSAPSNTWVSRRARRSKRSPSTASSSAPAPTAALKISAPPPASPRATRSPAHVGAMVVPGSQAVKAQAEAEGLDRIFSEAGFDWREPGCSMCLGMNPDILSPGERCASTSNRNFEGRQGRGGRTHLVSPEMAAAAAIAGHFVDIRNWPIHD